MLNNKLVEAVNTKAKTIEAHQKTISDLENRLASYDGLLKKESEAGNIEKFIETQKEKAGISTMIETAKGFINEINNMPAFSIETIDALWSKRLEEINAVSEKANKNLLKAYEAYIKEVEAYREQANNSWAEQQEWVWFARNAGHIRKYDGDRQTDLWNPVSLSSSLLDLRDTNNIKPNRG